MKVNTYHEDGTSSGEFIVKNDYRLPELVRKFMDILKNDELVEMKCDNFREMDAIRANLVQYRKTKSDDISITTDGANNIIRMYKGTRIRFGGFHEAIIFMYDRKDSCIIPYSTIGYSHHKWIDVIKEMCINGYTRCSMMLPNANDRKRSYTIRKTLYNTIKKKSLPFKVSSCYKAVYIERSDI